MKLEDIKLKLGDKITFKNGNVEFIESIDLDDAICKVKDLYIHISTINDIQKIERYEPSHYIDNEFSLMTIWEKEKDTNDDIEELPSGNLDEYEDLSDYDKFVILIRNRNKLNEIIRKLNEMGKSE